MTKLKELFSPWLLVVALLAAGELAILSASASATMGPDDKTVAQLESDRH